MVKLYKQNFKENQQRFYQIQKLLKNNISQNLEINHIGSTAIPNMIGKNIIDILIGAKDKTQFDDYLKKINNLGFFASDKSKTPNYQFFASKKEETISGDSHIHLSIIGSERYNDFLILKNYLLNNQNEAKNYSKFKATIINNFSKERNDYKKIKSLYVEQLLIRAKSKN